MTKTSKNVNLDSMLPREDFNIIGDITASTNNLLSLGIRDLEKSSLIRPHLRKPDFQRETNHWNPEQICSLIESFMDGDLIPSVIFWQSKDSPRIFVIDGGHRLSALCGWIEDDYGNGLTSKEFFGDEITANQKKMHADTQKLVNKVVGSFQYWKQLNSADQSKITLADDQKRRLQRFSSGTIPVQWVPGDADKAETSFFKINTQGTPLDEIEELLIKNRKKPIAIAARSIIRAGMGHKYWSDFSHERIKIIEEKAKKLNKLLFEPEYDTPIKTLDLPLGGTAGVRTALSLLIDYILLANRNQQGAPKSVEDQSDDTGIESDDSAGLKTIEALNRTLELTQRMTGNENGSLGLHPAIYFYGSSGRFSAPNFMGMATLIARKLINNDKTFFVKFTEVRKDFEDILIQKRALLGTISQQTGSKKRYSVMADLFEFMIYGLAEKKIIDTNILVEKAGLKVDVLVPKAEASAAKFSDDTKSAVYIKTAIASALLCPVCEGYLSVHNSVSYDHVLPLKNGGKGGDENCQLLHPYCNQSIKQ